MKNTLILITMIASLTSTASASVLSKETNAVIKECLNENNYSSDQFDTFDLNKVAGCLSDHLAAVAKEKRELRKNKTYVKRAN